MKKLLLVGCMMLLSACQHINNNQHSTSDKGNQQADGLSIPYEQITLDNGLSVIFHIDRSDPVVAVALTAHVGSAREKPGLTGFAHLFEHLLFLESENLGKGGLDQMSARIGGSGANGSTSRDATNYFQTVPNDALEKMIWAEADKLGYFINTVTEPVLAKEKEVVKNEKRQSIDNRPYGHTQYVIGKNLYPENHPYNWQVIGSLQDLQNATLADVKEFFRKWYTPNNVTLVIAGDFDVVQAKKWVHKYFDEINRGQEVQRQAKQPVTLSTTKSLYYEDNFAQVPELTYVWPTVPNYHPDSYALNVLSQYLSIGKLAPLNRILIDENKLTSDVQMYQYNSELSGETGLVVRAFDQVKLDDVADAIDQAFIEFETNGIPLSDLNRIKASQETNFYTSIGSVLGKAFQLAEYKIFVGDPGFVNQDIQNILNVSADDVMEVYHKYIKGKNFIKTSFVPKGQKNLALKGAKPAIVQEEQIINNQEDTFDPSIVATYERTPSSFDRSIEPDYGPSPQLKVPEIWKTELTSGIKLIGIENDEVPLVRASMRIKGGLLNESKDLLGVSHLLAELMTKGTQNKTPAEFEYAIDNLGASLSVGAAEDGVYISINTLSKNYAKVMDLVNEMILQPRWDETELALLKQQTLAQIQQQLANPSSIANLQFDRLIYGEDHIYAYNQLGTQHSVNTITMTDLQEYFNRFIAPNVSSFSVVGDISQQQVIDSLQTLNQEWSVREIVFKAMPEQKGLEKPQLYFYDFPGAKQSQLRFGYQAMKFTDDDYYPAAVMNYRLGGGGFASQLTQQLRESKGYTYGIRSGFSGAEIAGSFTVASGVRSNVTYESTELIIDILKNYGKNFNDTDLAISQGFLIKSNARRFETLGAKLAMLNDIQQYDLPEDYILQREKIVRSISVDDIKNLAEKYVNPQRMNFLIVGDAKSQLQRLEQLGLGPVILLNEQ